MYPSKNLPIILTEIESLLEKGAIEPVPISQINSGFYSTFFLVPKKDRRFKTNNKSSTAEQVYVETTFLNGYTDKSVKFGKAKRLGNISGPDRRISTHSDTQVPSEISTFQHSGTRLSVPGSSVRSLPESTLFHQNNLSRNGSFDDAQRASSLISRQLAYGKCNQENVAVRLREIAQSFAQTGVFGKLGEIIPSTQSEYYFHRSSIPVSEKYSTSYPGEDSQIAFSHPQFDRRSQHGTRFFTPFGANGLMYRTDSQCKTIHEANTITPSSFLETSHKRYANDSASYTTPKRSFEVVARYSKQYSGQVFNTTVRPDHNHKRCFQNWFWGSHEKSDLSGPLDKNRSQTTYQYLRNGSSDSNNKIFSSTTTRSECSVAMRQYNSGTKLPETRRDQVSQSLLQDLGTLSNDNKTSHSDSSCTFSMPQKYFGRPIIQDQSSTSRMGFERSNHEQDICNFGETYDRPICIGQQSQTANILFVDSVQESIRNRRSVNSMEQHGSTCLSSNLPGSQSPGTYVAGPLSDHSNSTTVAQETLVHKPVTKSNRLSSSKQSSSSTKNKNISSQSRNVQFDSMAALNQNFRNSGFSAETRKTLTAS